MLHLPKGIVVERTPLRDLARRLVEVLYEAGVPAAMSARTGLAIGPDGELVGAASWDVRVAESAARRAREALAEARRTRTLQVGVGRARTAGFSRHIALQHAPVAS